MTDPFAAPAVVPSGFPTTGSFRGRLILISPKKQETRPSNLGNPGDTQEVVTADVIVVDGLGPVPIVKGNPPTPTGQTLDGPNFTGMWFTNQVIIIQLQDALRTGGMVLARVDTRVPGTNPGKGNAWGLIDPTEADKQTARDFLAGRLVSSASSPAQPVPQAGAPAPGTNPFA